ncbi:MAG: alanine racemase [Rhodothermaceae bacterium]|nr:alanine racemase [Rhodothermaceae bacterium]
MSAPKLLSSTQFYHNANPDTPRRAYTTIAQIDLGRLRENAKIIKTLAAPAEVMAVVKANAYGHGAIPVAKTLLEEGFNSFLVATLSEALFLRENGIHAPILIAMPPLGANLPVYTREHFMVSVSSDEVCEEVLAYAETGQKLQLHVKLDTGMNRLGLSPDRAHSFISQIMHHPSLELQGIWTHLATAGQEDTAFARQQISSARAFTNQIHGFSGSFHVGNSSSLIHPDHYLDSKERTMYRVGGGLLGISAMPQRAREIGLVPIMTLKSHVLTVKSVSAGESVSYGRRWTAPKDTRIAVVGAGYADGYPSTCLQDESIPKRQVTIRGRRYPVVGSICMDMFMVDLGSEPAEATIKSGDEVILFGAGGPNIDELAQLTGRKAYEISCSISQRVVRTYS